MFLIAYSWISQLCHSWRLFMTEFYTIPRKYHIVECLYRWMFIWENRIMITSDFSCYLWGVSYFITHFVVYSSTFCTSFPLLLVITKGHICIVFITIHSSWLSDQTALQYIVLLPAWHLTYRILNLDISKVLNLLHFFLAIM